MQSNADKRDSKFLNGVKRKFVLINLNNTLINFDNIINKLEEPLNTKSGAPDFQFSNGYIEKFDLTSSKRVLINNKKQSIHCLSENLMRRKIKKDENNLVFQDYYYAGNELTSFPDEPKKIQYLHENLFDLVEQKTSKIYQYNKNTTNNNMKGLLIDIQEFMYVFKRQDETYATDKSIDINNLKKEIYWVCKDLNIIKKLHSKYCSNWDFILFTKYYSDVFLKDGEWCQDEKYYVFTIDLNMPLQEEKLINYPNPILHLQEGHTQVHIMGNRGADTISNR